MLTPLNVYSLYLIITELLPLLGVYILSRPACGCSNQRHAGLSLAKEKVTKEKPPWRVGLRPLCALQLTAGAAEFAALRQSSR